MASELFIPGTSQLITEEETLRADFSHTPSSTLWVFHIKHTLTPISPAKKILFGAPEAIFVFGFTYRFSIALKPEGKRKSSLG